MAARNEGNAQRRLTVPPIGSMLVACEYILPQDLDFALEHQKYGQGRIGEILLRIGAVEPGQLEKVLTLQKKLSSK